MAEHYPIVYIRGYAMTDGEVEDTFNKPYYGFNLGSTQYRQGRHEKPVMRIFESPIIRLIKDERYVDSFNRFVDANNNPIAKSVDADPEDINWKQTMWVFRYYDPESKIGGEQERVEIEDYAAQLALFLDKVRKACGSPSGFAVNLVAHSMGGLVARCYLQNTKLFKDARLSKIKPVKVNKMFTYGTPHKGITFRRGLGWIEDIRDAVGFAGSDTFGEERMREFLSLKPQKNKKPEPLHTYKPMPHAPAHEKVMCLVGTNYQDYVVWGSKKAVGPGSDGLVAIENAYVREAPRAYIHRAHSGPFGIVNSEGGYQNLTRFLFGDYRFELALEPVSVIKQLPGLGPDDELSHLLIDVGVTVRGLTTYVQRREEQSSSAITMPMKKQSGSYVQEKKNREHLYTGYLRTKTKMKDAPCLRGMLEIRIEPHYKHSGFIRDSRFEGESFMQDRMHIGVFDKAGVLEPEFCWSSGDEPLKDTGQTDGSHLIPFPATALRYLKCAGIRVSVEKWS